MLIAFNYGMFSIMDTLIIEVTPLAVVKVSYGG